MAWLGLAVVSGLYYYHVACIPPSIHHIIGLHDIVLSFCTYLFVEGETSNLGGILNRHDLDIFSSISFNHTFSLLLDSGLRVYAHVLRYLPIHPDVTSRLDVARRAERAMVILTRAVGGEQFYSSLLKAIQAISMEKLSANDVQRNQNLVTAFLHAIYKRHFLLRARCSAAMERSSMKILADEFKTISIHGAEMYNLSFHDEGGGGKRLFMERDILSFKLPLSLQPGYDGNNLAYECEDVDSPILPLLRCLGPGKTIRVLSAMLCEVRIIFVSKYVDTISSCVRSAMAMLAQGLLVWRHVSIPVLPPHLFRFLSAGAPYIVGVLDRYADRIARVRGLKDVLSINLDTGNLKIYNMEDPKKMVPDLMEAAGKTGRKQKNFIATEMLARDFNDVLEIDRKLWGILGDAAAAGAPALPETAEIINANKNRNLLGMAKTASEKLLIGGGKKDNEFFDAAAKFVVSMQGGSGSTDEKEKPLVGTDSKPEDHVDKAVELPSKPITKRPFSVCDNEQGEEMLRASLICFFLELFGDLGLYLLMSKSSGSLKVDKKKFLVRKTQMGVSEKSPMWYVLKQFSRSIMFERFVNGRIEDAEKHAKKNSTILLDHVPIFSLCQKHLRKTKSDFSTSEIRRVVFTTIEGCPQHKLVEKLENVRERALAITADKPFEGEEVAEIKKLIDECKQCNLSHDQVMAVIWLRIGETKPNLWKHNLLGLHLLKNFVLHGPATAISAAVDGIAEIYVLRFYANKNADAVRSIQSSARQLFFLLNFTCLMFSRRRKALALKVQKAKTVDESVTWSNYLIRRLPHNVGFKHIHVMFSPSDTLVPSVGGADKNGTEADDQDPVNYEAIAIPIRRLDAPRPRTAGPEFPSASISDQPRPRTADGGNQGTTVRHSSQNVSSNRAAAPVTRRIVSDGSFEHKQWQQPSVGRTDEFSHMADDSKMDGPRMNGSHNGHDKMVKPSMNGPSNGNSRVDNFGMNGPSDAKNGPNRMMSSNMNGPSNSNAMDQKNMVPMNNIPNSNRRINNLSSQGEFQDVQF